jgi:FtsP/CotA-like multicopper oxidase with cupredoxin domain
MVPVLRRYGHPRLTAAGRHRNANLAAMKLSVRRLVGAAGGILLGAALVAGVGWAAYSWYESRLPDTFSVMDMGVMEDGGGPAPSEHALHRGTSIERLRGPEGKPDVRFTLTAQRTTVRLGSGRAIDALTFNGRVPGPELRVRQRDLVQVTLVNKDVDDGVTIHWHGVHVPNAEDGVAGVTQNAVLPGERYTYRFRPHQVGTFWYHTHQVSSEEVRRGLYGALVVLPERASTSGFDITALAHNFSGVDVLGADDRPQRQVVPRGTPVRIRLVNTDSFTRRFVLSGTSFRVLAIDGADLNGPGLISRQTLELGAGARYDVGFVMPATPVRLGVKDSSAAMTFSREGNVDAPPVAFDEMFDPGAYGRPKQMPFDAAGAFDRHFTMDIDRKLGFFDGGFGYQWTVNGRIFPDTPMYVVREGDLVKVTITNESGSTHPMHLHGHHMLVLSRDEKPVSGSPWSVDTLNVLDGETYEVAFRGDNPGVWMDHCHILPHAAEGLTMHLMYEGYRTPFKVGGPAENEPE